MSNFQQTSPSEVLDFGPTQSNQRDVLLPEAICFGSTSSGGIVASAMSKHALLYAAQQPKLVRQKDIRSTHVQFYRPIFPAKGPVTMIVREISVGRAFSTLRVETFQGGMTKIAASSDILITDLSNSGPSHSTGWDLHPPPTPVTISKLALEEDPNWASFHLAFNLRLPIRGFCYTKAYLPTVPPQHITYTESWVTPGWNCPPAGSPDPGVPTPRWTNELIEFLADLNIPIEANFHPNSQDVTGSVLNTLSVAALQHQNRKEGKLEWRKVPLSALGLQTHAESAIQATLSMTTEIKKRLPDEGVEWLYLRGECKSIENGRMDSELVMFDEGMGIVAVSYQVVVLIPSVSKNERKANIEML
ncbi:hypothetical protein P154DRAFT_599064 [Amniculicola lignicola CBS 123094]|uniref:Thioesterase family protein n=1 Tax=Amniculicola lignicola CBS 123094 TaxID=1392246 RepID=A0A6A5WM66_9PLEO|nr:hypothetical protein P154DRAFT_599064 [Amniculicola lignicola CBS 123094]